MHARNLFMMLALAVLAGSGAARAAAIHDAAGKGDLAAVKVAVSAKPATVNERDAKKATPLHYAAAGGHTAVIEFLVARKADVNARKPDGVTPLHVAAAMGRSDAARILLAHGADRNAKDKAGRTPLSLAKAKGFKGLAAMLQPKTVAKPTGKPHPVTADLKTRTLVIIRSLEAGNYPAVTRQFDSTMSAAMSPAQLGQVWQGLKTQYGPFRRLGDVRTKSITADGVSVTAAIVPGEFGSTPLNVQISFMSDGSIGGFFVLNPEASL